MKNINIKVEILRIIACINVIWYHIRELPWKTNGELQETAVFFESLCTICVMTFFLISGFFIYNKKNNIIKDWVSLLKNFFVNIFIPFIIIAIITIIFHDFFVSSDTFINCIKKTSFSTIYYTLFFTFKDFSANYLPGTAAHLWYIFSYSLIIIFYPITRILLTKLNKYFLYAILLILTIMMIINDYFLFYGIPTFNIVFKIIPKPIYYSAIGHILYNDILKKYIGDVESKKYIINIKLFIPSSIVYILSFISVFLVQCAYYKGTNNAYVYTSWLSTFSLVMTISFIICVYNINFDKFINDTIKNILLFISKKTFMIYMIHYLVITKFSSMGIQSYCHQNFTIILQYFLYYLFYGAIIFFVTFDIVMIIDIVINAISNKFKKFF